MKKFQIIFFIFSFTFQNSFSQAGEWVWLHGDSTQGSGNYGIQGVSSPNNDPPALYEPCEWADLNGNLWLYGGVDVNGWGRDDLWKYDPTINEWTWIKGSGIPNGVGSFGTQGIPSPLNNPPALGWGTPSWVDDQGDFWLFGGGGSTTVYSDLWKYNISTNEWTWIKGPGIGFDPGVYGIQGVADPLNNPASRGECSASWIDNIGNLWFFGGWNQNYYNDLWKYNISANEWTWMKGSDTVNQSGVYGSLGIESVLNTPGARQVFAKWMDNYGNFWIFGGGGYPGLILNDMWRFNPVTNNWTWMNGNILPGQSGSYGMRCLPSLINIPGSRGESRAATTDSRGNFWLFGGFTTFTSVELANDLWMYCVATNKWSWISGDSIGNSVGRFGIKGVSNPGNKPHSTCGNVCWADNNENIFFFGSNSNALWKFSIDTTCAPCASVIPQSTFTTTNNFICPGTCIDFINYSIDATSYQWFFPGANPDTSIDLNPSNICYPSPGAYDVQLIASNANGSDTLLLTDYITVYPSPAPQAISQSGDTLFAIAGSNSYQWYYNGNLITGATDYFYVASASGDYNVIATDTNGCEVEAVINNVIANTTPLSPDSYRDGEGSGLRLYPNPVGTELIFKNDELIIEAAITISIYNLLGELAVQAETRIYRPETPIDVSGLSPGMYWLDVSAEGKTFRAKFVKQ